MKRFQSLCAHMMVGMLMLSFFTSIALPVHDASAQQLVTKITVLQKCNDSSGCGWQDFLQLVREGLGFMFFLASLLIVISISYAGWLFITGGSNEGNIKKARGILWNVVIGVVFMMTGWLIIDYILTTLGVGEDYRLIQ